MKRFYPLLFIFLLPAISACNSNKLEPATHAAKNNCPARSDKAAMYSLALSVIDKHDNDNIWNLAEIDTTDFAVSENYFTNTKTRNRLVLEGRDCRQDRHTGFSCFLPVLIHLNYYGQGKLEISIS